MIYPTIRCRNLCKQFQGVRAICGVNLEVHKGEFITLLGESGCGKTTVLRLIAGFERPDHGNIFIEDCQVSGKKNCLPPEKRSVGMVFQEYALFPHLNVEKNIRYGIQKQPNASQRVREILDLVGLNSLSKRMPHELSGGQQQRVAIARALAPQPKVMLLDEPFSNLDYSLRVKLRTEIRSILRYAKATVILVTHDQEEALSLSDRVAVLMNYRVVQVDTPQNVYLNPVSKEVANFIGEANIFSGMVRGNDVFCPIGIFYTKSPHHGQADVMIRPENILVKKDNEGIGRVVGSEYFGHDQLIKIEIASCNDPVLSRIKSGRKCVQPGDRVSLDVRESVMIYPKKDVVRSYSSKKSPVGSFIRQYATS